MMHEKMSYNNYRNPANDFDRPTYHFQVSDNFSTLFIILASAHTVGHILSIK